MMARCSGRSPASVRASKSAPASNRIWTQSTAKMMIRHLKFHTERADKAARGEAVKGEAARGEAVRDEAARSKAMKGEAVRGKAVKGEAVRDEAG